MLHNEVINLINPIQNTDGSGVIVLFTRNDLRVSHTMNWWHISMSSTDENWRIIQSFLTIFVSLFILFYTYAIFSLHVMFIVEKKKRCPKNCLFKPVFFFRVWRKTIHNYEKNGQRLTIRTKAFGNTKVKPNSFLKLSLDDCAIYSVILYFWQ